MARPTSDAKDSTIKLRINDSQRKHIEKASTIKHITMSEYIRKLINDDMRLK